MFIITHIHFFPQSVRYLSPLIYDVSIKTVNNHGIDHVAHRLTLQLSPIYNQNMNDKQLIFSSTYSATRGIRCQ